ncbi:MAG: fumarylacetoacetate hydrolase family protein [Trueperaceae bacterium]
MKIIRAVTRQGETVHAEQKSDGRSFELQGDLYSGFTTSNREVEVTKLLAPLVPLQILGIGLNYRHHANESNMPIPEYPVLFTKGPNTVQNPQDPIVIPTHMQSDEVDYEAELAVVIGRDCKNASRSEALDFVLGYTCANDVSARDWQLRRGGGQWSRGKYFDTFCPLGPCLIVDEIDDPNSLRISTALNSEVVQDWNTNDMIFDVPSLIEFLSASTTLPAGTVILTGTPHGVGMAAEPPRWLREGDTVCVEIEGVGALINPVVNESNGSSGQS